MSSQYASKVRIEGVKEGAILIGNNIACDGTTIDRPVSIISHAHGDHTRHFESALSHCETVLMTPETKELIIAERGSYLRWRRNMVGLTYETALVKNEEKVTLYPAKHMLGACQVLYENCDGTRIVYTGDFDYPSTPVIEADVLVMEATYGALQCVRDHDKSSLLEKIIQLTENEIRDGRPVNILAHRGKIQSLMCNLKSAGVTAPFLAIPQDCRWAEVYQKYCFDVGDVLEIGTTGAYEIERSGDACVIFNRIGSTNVPSDRLTIRASAFMARKDFYKRDRNYHVVALSDHADLVGLLEYARNSHAKSVIVDGSRCSNAYRFAKILKKETTIAARVMP